MSWILNDFRWRINTGIVLIKDAGFVYESFRNETSNLGFLLSIIQSLLSFCQGPKVIPLSRISCIKIPHVLPTSPQWGCRRPVLPAKRWRHRSAFSNLSKSDRSTPSRPRRPPRWWDRHLKIRNRINYFEHFDRINFFKHFCRINHGQTNYS